MLFDRLEKFVNLKDTLEDFRTFFSEHPNFQPVEFHDSKKHGTRQGPEPVAWQPEFHKLFLAFRDMLREVWQRGSNSSLAILLGTDAKAWEIIDHSAKPGFLSSVLHGPEQVLHEAVQSIPKSFFPWPLSQVRPEWQKGAFSYEANTDFRRAVYLLFKQNWRAKICPRCRRYFVADKPPQLYCSTKCYGEAKKNRDLEYWKNIGSPRRQARLERQHKRTSKSPARRRRNKR